MLITTKLSSSLKSWRIWEAQDWWILDVRRSYSVTRYNTHHQLTLNPRELSVCPIGGHPLNVETGCTLGVATAAVDDRDAAARLACDVTWDGVTWAVTWAGGDVTWDTDAAARAGNPGGCEWVPGGGSGLFSATSSNPSARKSMKRCQSNDLPVSGYIFVILVPILENSRKHLKIGLPLVSIMEQMSGRLCSRCHKDLYS